RGTACKKRTPQVRRNTGNSLRNGFTAYTRALRSTGLVSLRRPAIRIAELDPSVGGSGPRDFARPPMHRSSADTKASIAPRTPRLVTIGRTSLLPRRDVAHNHFLPKNERTIFFARGLDNNSDKANLICPSCRFCNSHACRIAASGKCWNYNGSAPGLVLINLRRSPVRPDTDRLCATTANVAMGQEPTSFEANHSRKTPR